MANRIKGQEVVVALVIGGEQVEAFTDVRNFEMTAQLELLSEGYLGETTDRRDEVYRGVAGRMDLHFHTADVFNTMRSVVDRARKRTPGVQINVTATLQFDDGTRSVILIPDAKFGEFPLSFGSRSEFGSIGVSFEAQDYQVISR